jgi:hypothetical protein
MRVQRSTLRPKPSSYPTRLRSCSRIAILAKRSRAAATPRRARSSVDQMDSARRCATVAPHARTRAISADPRRPSRASPPTPAYRRPARARPPQDRTHRAAAPRVAAISLRLLSRARHATRAHRARTIVSRTAATAAGGATRTIVAASDLRSAAEHERELPAIDTPPSFQKGARTQAGLAPDRACKGGMSGSVRVDHRFSRGRNERSGSFRTSWIVDPVDQITRV